jgi:DNA-binding response OmpR family regulator
VHGRGNILIVETDDLIRQLLEQWLQEAGYAVRIADRDAAGTVAAPDLVVVNLARPRGAEGVVRQLAERYAAPILVTSARFRRGLGASDEAARSLGVRRVLPKPFTRDELLDAVRAVLGHGHAPA